MFGIFECQICTVESYIRGNQLEISNSKITNRYLPFSIKQIPGRGKCSKDMYRMLNEKILYQRVSRNGISRQFQGIEFKWKVLYSIPAYCSSNTKLHWFQYRILHRILATYNLLWKYKIKGDNLCTFWQTFPETLDHLFLYSEEVHPFERK